MTLTRNMKFLTLLLILSLLLLAAGCDSSGQPLFPNTYPGQSTQGTLGAQGETQPAGPSEPPLQQLPSFDKELEAVQCYYQGQLTREYVITYDEMGRMSTLQIHTYDKGNLYSWGENHFTYDDRGNLLKNEYVYSLGTQRWEYENEYNDQGLLTGYQETEYYNDNLVNQRREDCLYDEMGRYLGGYQPEEVTFDEYGRVLSIQVRVARGDYLADMDVTCDYSNAPVMLCHIHTVFPEYEQFSSDIRLMLNRYHVAFGLDMKDGYQFVTDEQGLLSRVTDENGSDVYLFIYH